MIAGHYPREAAEDVSRRSPQRDLGRARRPRRRRHGGASFLWRCGRPRSANPRTVGQGPGQEAPLRSCRSSSTSAGVTGSSGWRGALLECRSCFIPGLAGVLHSWRFRDRVEWAPSPRQGRANCSPSASVRLSNYSLQRLTGAAIAGRVSTTVLAPVTAERHVGPSGAATSQACAVT